LLSATLFFWRDLSNLSESQRESSSPLYNSISKFVWFSPNYSVFEFVACITLHNSNAPPFQQHIDFFTSFKTKIHQTLRIHWNRKNCISKGISSINMRADSLAREILVNYHLIWNKLDHSSIFHPLANSQCKIRQFS